MTSTITITTAATVTSAAAAPSLREDIALMLTVLEVALTSVAVALAVVTALIALFAIFGRRDIIQKAEEIAYNSAQKTADKAMGDFLQSSNISGIVEKYITERGDKVEDLIAEKMADRLYRKRQEKEKRDANTPTPSKNEKTKESKDV